jgi:peptidoglycan/LPS O-acetylase OafA/YrhL
MSFRDRRVPPLIRPPPPRIRINLRKGLPAWIRYPLAIAIVAAISIGAWIVGRDRPTPAWISEGLVPALGWIYLVLVAIAVVHWIRKLRAKRTGRKEHGA